MIFFLNHQGWKISSANHGAKSLLDYMPFVPTCLTCLRAIRAYAPYVPTCLRASNYYVSTCLKLLRALRYYVPTCLRASNYYYVPTCLTLLCAYLPTCPYFYVPTCLRDYIYLSSLRTFVPWIISFLRALIFHVLAWKYLTKYIEARFYTLYCCFSLDYADPSFH